MIHAPASKVWPWLVQMGCGDRAGYHKATNTSKPLYITLYRLEGKSTKLAQAQIGSLRFSTSKSGRFACSADYRGRFCSGHTGAGKVSGLGAPTPGLCTMPEVDFGVYCPMSRAMKLGMDRTGTLTDGVPRCDFRFKRGKPTREAPLRGGRVRAVAAKVKDRCFVTAKRSNPLELVGRPYP